MKLKIGDKAPNFSLPDENKVEHKLSDYLGKFVFLYFYPKDDTPGCTIEAKEIKEEYENISGLNAIVLGISKDNAPSHIRFIEKYSLPFTLLSDKDKSVAELYGALGKKKFMGQEYMGVLRNSYLIDDKGIVKKIYEEVKPEGHAVCVLQDLKKLSA